MPKPMNILLVAVLVAAQDAASSQFGCQSADLWNKTCFHNPSGRLGPELQAKTAEACCSHCASTSDCASWTWYGGTNCNLFKDVHDANAGDPTCVSGTGKVPPPPAPPTPSGPTPKPAPPACAHPPCIHGQCTEWTPPPAPGAPCKDCPNIIFSLTDGTV
jgi:hypothetical protein